VNAWVEGTRGAFESFEGHGSSEIGGMDQVTGTVEIKHAECSHEGGTIGERQPFLGTQVDRL